MLFLRCGYPLTKDIVKNTIFTDEQKRSIHILLSSFGIEYDFGKLPSWTAYDKILDILAGAHLYKTGWGGKTRSIYEEESSNLVGVVCTVIAKKIVKTGEYVSSCGGHCYYTGEYDYTPAYLEKSKTHVILKLLTHGTETVSVGTEVLINKSHVEKIYTKDYSCDYSNLPLSPLMCGDW